jgi:hypothetical protein
MLIDESDPRLRALVDACTPDDDAAQQIRQLQSEVEHYRNVRQEQRGIISTYESEMRRVLDERESARDQRDWALIVMGLMLGAMAIWWLAK